MKTIKLGITFDDFTAGDEGEWSQVCNGCVEKFSIPKEVLDENVGSGTCGIEGCWNESVHYIDFPNEELAKETNNFKGVMAKN